MLFLCSDPSWKRNVRRRDERDDSEERYRRAAEEKDAEKKREEQMWKECVAFFNEALKLSISVSSMFRSHLLIRRCVNSE